MAFDRIFILILYSEQLQTNINSHEEIREAEIESE